MRRAFFLLIPVFGLLALAACKEVQIENGEVPSKYLSLAQRYTGVYRGEMEGVPGSLTLTLRGRQAVLLYTSEAGSDILDPRCQSQIGRLKSVRVDEPRGGGYELTGARFEFNPNRCWQSVLGREVALSFSRRGERLRVSAAILRETAWENRCRIEPGNPSAGVPPREVCSPQATPEYFKGYFKR